MKKQNNVSVNDLTEKEISIVEANDKLLKLEKEKARDKKIIAEYKEREKSTARALILYERKIKYLKENAVKQLLAICSNISSIKDEYEEETMKIAYDFIKENMLNFKDGFSLLENNIYDVCNFLEKNAILTNEDRAFISNKKPAVSNEPGDLQSRFDRLKQEFSQKIGSSVLRKPGRPKKSEQSIIADIGLRKKVEKYVDENETSKNKLNELFYDAPENKNVVSSIPNTDGSLFDFNEALNPNLSLKDIMDDILTEKQEDVVTYNESVRKIEDSKRQSDIELLESGFIKPRSLINKQALTQNRTIDPIQKKPTYDKRFLSIQNVISDTIKK